MHSIMNWISSLGPYPIVSIAHYGGPRSDRNSVFHRRSATCSDATSRRWRRVLSRSAGSHAVAGDGSGPDDTCCAAWSARDTVSGDPDRTDVVTSHARTFPSPQPE